MPPIAWVHAARTRVSPLMPRTRFKESLASQVADDPALKARDAVPATETARLDARIRGVLLRWHCANTAARWQVRRVLWVLGAVAVTVVANSPWARRPPHPTSQEVTDFVAGALVGGMLGFLIILMTFWRLVRYAIDSNGRTLQLCLVLVVLAGLGFTWHS